MGRLSRTFRPKDTPAAPVSGGGGRILLPNSGCVVKRPSYKHYLSMVFRPLPTLKEGTLNPLASRYSTASRDFTRWFIELPVVSYFGEDESSVSCVLYDPAAQALGEYDPNTDNPYVVLRERLRRMSAANRDSFPNYDRVMRMFRPVQMCGFLQALVLSIGDKRYVAEGSPYGLQADDEMPVVILTPSSKYKLLQLLDETNDGVSDGESGNYEKLMRYGEVVHPKYGRFVWLTRESLKSGGESNDVDSSSWTGSGDRSGRRGRRSGQDSRQGEAYEVTISDRISPSAKPSLASISKEDWRVVAPKIKDWSDIIFLPSTEELCAMLVRAAPRYGYVFKYGWSGMSQFLTGEVKGLLAKAKSVAMPVSTDDFSEAIDPEDDAVVSDTLRQADELFGGQEWDDDDDDSSPIAEDSDDADEYEEDYLDDDDAADGPDESEDDDDSDDSDESDDDVLGEDDDWVTSSPASSKKSKAAPVDDLDDTDSWLDEDLELAAEAEEAVREASRPKKKVVSQDSDEPVKRRGRPAKSASSGSEEPKTPARRKSVKGKKKS